ncbi:hypothetical protein PUN4_330149 [Paraburkholderia unamae]|nr:hypothetical protein PUN4_330149 [Paraburkholderia unamae]
MFRFQLIAQKVSPTRRTAELTVAILMLAATRRGIAVLPRWAVHTYLQRQYVTGRPITPTGLSDVARAQHRAPGRRISLARQGDEFADAAGYRALRVSGRSGHRVTGRRPYAIPRSLESRLHDEDACQRELVSGARTAVRGAHPGVGHAEGGGDHRCWRRRVHAR